MKWKYKAMGSMVFAIYQILLGWIRLKNVLSKLWKPTNAIITQGHNLTQEKNGEKKQILYENQRKPYNPRRQPNPRKWKKIVGSTILAVFSCFS